jgi:hypothetical protein
MPTILRGPQRIVCLTEETTEWLYLLGEEARIVGISGYTVRPRRAREEKPRVSAFLSAKIDRILALEPDCVFGFSDLQADIAAQLVRQGVQVTVFNQRSVEEIFSVLLQVAAIVGAADRGLDHQQARPHALQQAQAVVGPPDHRGHLVQHGEDLLHAALVEHRDLHALPDQLGRDVRLQVGKTEDAVRLERQDLVDLRGEEGAHLRLLVTRAARPHGVAGDADDARLLAQQVQPLRRLLGQAHDALRRVRSGCVRHRVRSSRGRPP